MTIARSSVILTVHQVAARLQVNPYTVREMLRSGELRGFKLRGRRWRVRESDLDEFVDRCPRGDTG